MADAMGELDRVLVALVSGLIGVLWAFWLTSKVLNAPEEFPAGSKPAKYLKNLAEEAEKAGKRPPKLPHIIGQQINEGAIAFLTAEYFYMACFVVVMAVATFFATDDPEIPDNGWKTVVSFIVGAILSASCGWMGMYIATKANVRTCVACTDPKTGLNNGLAVAFNSGAVMGISVVSSGMLGVSIMYVALGGGDLAQETKYLAGFGFGASSIALFARVGGGIYTKAADVGADLVGKVEAGLPEDDPRNPATIADNVGDNVGDVAGMGADLFESFVGSIIGCVQLAPVFVADRGITENSDVLLSKLIAYPFYVAGTGLICSLIATLIVKAPEETAAEESMSDAERSNHRQHVLLNTIRYGIIFASVLGTVAALVCAIMLFDDPAWDGVAIDLWLCTLVGLISGYLIGEITEYTTSFAHTPTQSISKKSRFGPAGVVIQGIGVGMLSTMPPVCIIFVAILACVELSGVYGVAIAAVGMLSTLGITLATDAYGPVADNAGGIAEMAELPEDVRERTDALDAMGNTTAATGKGFAIGSAVLTALALLAAFKGEANLQTIDISKSYVLAAAIYGAMLPYIFGALTMLAVGRSAAEMIQEVRDQFAEKDPQTGESLILTGKKDPNVKKCVAISTDASIREMIIPGVLAVAAPLFIGFLLNAEALAGMLVGGITSGFMLAVFMSNAGGAWDNAKKWVEAEGLYNAYTTGKHKDLENDRKKAFPVEEFGDAYKIPKKICVKKSEWHKATVVGDTIGDPFKDTSGPSLNILIKLMTMISLVFAGAFAGGKTETLTLADETFRTVSVDVEPFQKGKWFVGVVVGVLFMVMAVGLTIYWRSTGAGKINMKDMDFRVMLKEMEALADVAKQIEQKQEGQPESDSKAADPDTQQS